jgi:hypothetical protein
MRHGAASALEKIALSHATLIRTVTKGKHFMFGSKLGPCP